MVLGLLIGLLFLFFILPLLASADQRFEQLIDQVFDAVFLQIALPEHLIAVSVHVLLGRAFLFWDLKRPSENENQRRSEGA